MTEIFSRKTDTVNSDHVENCIILKPGTKRSLSLLRDIDRRGHHSESTPPAFNDMDDVDADLFNENMTQFFRSWIPDTMRIFAPTGAAIHTQEFWASQMRNDLDHSIWQDKYLGREATEEELDWLVGSAIEINWPRIEKILDGRSSEKRMRSDIPDPDESAAGVIERRLRGSPTRTKLRRAFALEDVIANVCIDDDT